MGRGTAKALLSTGQGGVAENVSAVNVPPEQLAAGLNVIDNNGELSIRPGHTVIDTLTGAVMGFGFRGDPLTDTNLVIHTVSNAYKWDGSAATDITGTWTTTTQDDHVRFATFFQGGTLYILRTNLSNPIDEWDGGAGSFTSTAGSPPSGIDLTVTNGRILVIRADGDPHSVRWSGFNDRTDWSSLASAAFRETPGSLIAGRAFSNLSAAIYKTDSVYLATAQVGVAPFQFQLVQEVPGPVSPSALVVLQGVHYWLAHDGNMYSFDGSRVVQLTSQLPVTIQNTFDFTNRQKCHGFVVDRPQPEVWFFYPDSATALLTRAICLNPRTGAQYPQQFTQSITASHAWNAVPAVTIDQLTMSIDNLDLSFPSIDAMGGTAQRVAILGDKDGNISRFNQGSTDNGTDITWEFDHGWKAFAGLDNRFYLDGVASYWRNMGSSVQVDIGLRVTDTLGDTEMETKKTIDLSTDSNHLVTFPNVRGKWIRVRHAGLKALPGMAFRGAGVFGWPRSMV